jgi:protein-L-isoaspartate(D-aspartate) O-methyltransferase
MTNNQELVNQMLTRGVLYTPVLTQAFLRYDRIDFIPKEFCNEAYYDGPLPIGEGQTISQPSTVAIMLELLSPQAGDKVLDIGSGSGWTTALLASIVGEDGFVEGFERIPFLVKYGQDSLSRANISNASIDLAKDGVLGNPEHLYDCILVSASATQVPVALFEQLKTGGIMVIPILSSVWRFKKEEGGTISAYELPGFRFVPLIVF